MSLYVQSLLTCKNLLGSIPNPFLLLDIATQCGNIPQQTGEYCRFGSFDFSRAYRVNEFGSSAENAFPASREDVPTSGHIVATPCNVVHFCTIRPQVVEAVTTCGIAACCDGVYLTHFIATCGEKLDNVSLLGMTSARPSPQVGSLIQ